MYKQSDIITPLLPHQRNALAKARKHNLLLAHSMGSGKTLTSIAIADALGKPATVLTPASLVENYKKEIAKHKVGGPPMEVYSLPYAAAHGIKIPQGNTVILDEVHALRTPGSQRRKYVREQLAQAGRVIGLTGTPSYNGMENMAPLVNLIARESVLPSSPEEFKSRYTQDKFFGTGKTLRNPRELQSKLQKWVDAFDIDLSKPKRIEEYINVPMTPEQDALYTLIEKDMPRYVRNRLRSNLPPSKSEAKSFNSFLSGVRQVANTPRSFNLAAGEGAKITESVKRLKELLSNNPNGRALVYSNYLDAGINPIAEALDREKIPYAKFYGGLSAAQKKDIVSRYNDGKLPVILGSGSASEGLDLKGTSLIQILEPHFNNARLEQVIGRGIRYKSHDHLPEDQRKVLVQRFLAVKPNTGLRKLLSASNALTVDGYLDSRSKEKDSLINEMRSLLVQN